MNRTTTQHTHGARQQPRQRWWAALLVLVLMLAGCTGTPAGDAASSAPQETISISGAFALFPMVSVWAEAYQKVNPNVRFDVQAGGAGKGMTDVLAGAVDVAMLSRDVRTEEAAQGAVLTPVVIDAVVGVANANNPHLAALQAKGLTPAIGAQVWLTQAPPTWGEWVGDGSSDRINVYTRSDAAGAAEMWAKYLGGTAQEELVGTAVNGDPGLAEAVRQDVLGVGYNNIGFAYDPATGAPITGLAIIPLDLNGDGQISADEDFYGQRSDLTAAIAQKTYPFPPARVLHLVTKGAPSQTVKDFYRWILTDGQQYVAAAGYVPLTDAEIQAALAALAGE
jgi:phosphate transport system substrate-binding protein